MKIRKTVLMLVVLTMAFLINTSAINVDSASPVAPTYEILHSFTGNDNHGFTGDTDGANPYGPLVQAPDGNFYGTTFNGSPSATAGTGTVFKMDSTGNITILHHFLLATTDGVNPYGGLVLAKDGNFYGTTYSAVGVTGSGSNGGVVFRISPTGQYKKLWTFTGAEGGLPKAGLIQAKDGSLYGTSTKGGYLAGAVFRMGTNGTPSLLHGFKMPDGVAPTCTLLQASDGNLYGTAYGGGAIGLGTVFKLTTSGGFTVIHPFGGPAAVDGSNPVGGLIEASDGNLYGTTATGGQYNLGTIFKIDRTGAYSVFHHFTVTEGARPFGNLLQASDGNLYGTTYAGGRNYGTVFKITLKGQLTVVHTFAEFKGDGAISTAGLIQGTDGKLYGTTYYGGNQNKGVVFRIDLGLGQRQSASSRSQRSASALFAHALPRDFTSAQITESNWVSHPAILTIRKIVNSVNLGLKKGVYKTSKREFESCGDQYYTLRRVARDSRSVVVWYQQYFNYEDGSFDFNHYYDQKGHLRFVLGTARAANGTRHQLRIYFDEAGKRIWETDELLKGPGCPGCFVRPYPDDQIAFDPLKAYETAEGCIEQKPQPRRKKVS